ncbi:MAG: hypothetical protein FD143_1613 [Ignavibacteria bacterium]|nr:MAG: hypothetical protein FD143_1613 [Ignavibacteria bacterium]KAF0160408.1 MAG: hypothetical protein FD188_1786 [Ignavibacteria bacterium]
METPSTKNLFTAENIKKYSPLVLLLFLTVMLMLFFKSNKKGISGMIEEGKKNLLSLYTSGLRPLISETEISQEDLFNFALYQSLPLDQARKKALMLSDGNGQMVYEIKPAIFNKNARNYETFKNYFELNDTEKRIADSVLNSYRKEIYSCVLVNKKNAYAINPKISTVRKAMLADLVYLTQKVSKEKAKEIFPSLGELSQNELAALIKTGRELPSTQYLLMTPDTIAKTDFTWDVKKFDEQLRAFEEGKIDAEDFVENQAFKWNEDVSLPQPPLTSSKHDSMFDYTIDSNKYKISFDTKQLSKIVNDSLKVNLDKAAKYLRSISVRIPKQKGSRLKYDNLKIIPPVTITPDAIYDAVQITESTLKIVGGMNLSNIIEEAVKNDSASQTITKDSGRSKRYKEKMKGDNKKQRELYLDSLSTRKSRR